MPDANEIEHAVRARYARAAETASACCSVPEEFGSDGCSAYGAARYAADELSELPAEAVAASIGCANPVAIADLQAGEDVLDLGSGGGIDVLLSARRVGPTGRAYGVDMTDEMLELARANQRKAGIDNAEFLNGHIEDVPLPDASVDVVLSNCVINLSPDKRAVFAETFRVLRPGGRVAVADVVADGPVDDATRADLAAWTECIAGALSRDEYEAILAATGFADVTITDSHAVAEGFTSVVVRATKPSAS
jgi:ubiquinone/menaquinone biosynthesis C-methylase UbiE